VVSFTNRPLYPQGKSPWYPLDRRLGIIIIVVVVVVVVIVIIIIIIIIRAGVDQSV
jgi:hypothetical protein